MTKTSKYKLYYQNVKAWRDYHPTEIRQYFVTDCELDAEVFESETVGSPEREYGNVLERGESYEVPIQPDGTYIIESDYDDFNVTMNKDGVVEFDQEQLCDSIESTLTADAEAYLSDGLEWNDFKQLMNAKVAEVAVAFCCCLTEHKLVELTSAYEIGV